MIGEAVEAAATGSVQTYSMSDFRCWLCMWQNASLSRLNAVLSASCKQYGRLQFQIRIWTQNLDFEFSHCVWHFCMKQPHAFTDLGNSCIWSTGYCCHYGRNLSWPMIFTLEYNVNFCQTRVCPNMVYISNIINTVHHLHQHSVLPCNFLNI